MYDRPRTGHEPIDAIFIGERDGAPVYVGQMAPSLTVEQQRRVAETVRWVDERGKLIDAKYFRSLGEAAIQSADDLRGPFTV
jgi:hypothetical protein